MPFADLPRSSSAYWDIFYQRAEKASMLEALAKQE
jgi:hypothetical protein